MDQDFDNEAEDLNQAEDNTDFSSDYSYSEPKKLFSKSFLIYGIALLWSFFIVFIFMYYLMYHRERKSFDLFTKHVMAPDSTVTADSLQPVISPLDSSSESFARDDSGRGYYVPPEGFLTMEDHMQILKLENGRRKREIDFLWNELRTLRNQTSEIEQLTQEVDSLKRVEPQTIVIRDSTPNFEMQRQQQLLEQQKEQDRLAKIEAQKQAEDAALAKSAKIYSSMKPKQAASILASFDSETAAQMLMKIRERQAAKILEAMEPQKATQICKYMAK